MLLTDAIQLIKKKLDNPYVDDGHKLELLDILEELNDFVEPDKKFRKNWYKEFKALDDELRVLAQHEEA